MAKEHSSRPGQRADMVTSVMAGITMNVEKLWRNIVIRRWPIIFPDAIFSSSPGRSLYLDRIPEFWRGE